MPCTGKHKDVCELIDFTTAFQEAYKLLRAAFEAVPFALTIPSRFANTPLPQQNRTLSNYLHRLNTTAPARMLHGI